MSETRQAVLEALAQGPHSGADLAETLDVSRAAVWKHVEALREQGFEIESGPDGYVLGDVPEYGEDAIRFGLDAPLDVEFHKSVASTNDLARERAESGAADLVIVAGEQTGGKGRLDREWHSPPGGIWCSILLRPDRPPATIPLFTLAAAVAITAAAREAGVDAGIKWPNDVLVRGGQSGSGADSEPKLAGILTEMEGEADRVEWLVVGMGINANLDADELPEGATSLREELGEDVNRRLFVQRVLERFDELRSDPDAILDTWRTDALTLGREVRVETASGETVEGTAIDVEQPGTLVVETADGKVLVHAGDCEHLRPT